MRLGIGTYTYPWAVGVAGHEPAHPMGAINLIQRASQLGVEVVQICDNLPLHELPAAERQHVGRSAAERGIRIQVGTRGSQVPHLRTYLDLAEEFRSPLLRVVVDSAADKPDPRTLVQRIRQIMPDLERRGIRLAIENHDRFTCAVLLEILEAVPSPFVGICLDTVNSFGALEGPVAVLNALLPHTICLHVKDFVIRRPSHSMGFEIEGAPAGQGRLNIPNILSQLRPQNPQADAILELWTPPEPDLDATVQREAEWAESSIDYLKKLLDSQRQGIIR